MYLSPDAAMPLASAAAAIAGIAVMFWHKTVGAFRAMFGFIGRVVTRLTGRR
ncbi:MAG: hypothetical protein ACRENB_09620 [Gemmatimonadales bacterium]